MSNESFWIVKLLAYLHDPPDKALKIEGHEDRADNIVNDMKIDKIPKNSTKIKKDADKMVASLQRISLEIDGAEPVIDLSKKNGTFIYNQKKYIYLSHNLLLLHPLTGEKIIGKYHLIQRHIDFTESKISTVASEIGNVNFDNKKELFIYVWRFFRYLLEQEMINSGSDRERVMEVLNLPADTRTPDHTIWDHMDLTSAVAGALYMGRPALLTFKISPVQNFIKNARKAKDLWAGSHLLSLLTFIGITTIIDEWGPDSIIFPYLRGQPFLDLYYRKILEKHEFSREIIDGVRKNAVIANIPNTALAIIGVPDLEDITTIEEKWEKTIRNKIDMFLDDLFDYSFKKLTKEMGVGNYPEDVLRQYKEIVRSYFNVTVKIINIEPFNIPNDLKKRDKKEDRYQYYLRNLINHIPDDYVKNKYEKWLEAITKLGSYGINELDLYPLAYEILMHLLGQKSRQYLNRNIPNLEGSKKSGKEERVDKCSMCGEFEAMKIFSDIKIDTNYPHLKKNEKLCPVCLIKRYYPDYMVEKGYGNIRLNRGDITIESVVDIAMRGKFKMKRGDDVKVAIWAKEVKIDELERELKKYVLANYFYDKDIYFADVNSITDKDLENYGFTKEKLENVRQIIKKYIKERPPAYYSILVMDGDNIGMVLNGELMKNIKEYIHEDIEKFVDESNKKYINYKRLITPTIHAAFSRSLMNFSVKYVKDIVEKHRGKLVYSGGDDVLAFLPRDSGFSAAFEISRIFSQEKDENLELLPGLKMSGGLLIAHYKHPLYSSVELARNLEKLAKNSGKNALAIGYLERSGSYLKVVVSWDIFDYEKGLAFYKILNKIYHSIFHKEGAKLSPRFIYALNTILNDLDENTADDIIYDLFVYQYYQHISSKKYPPPSWMELRETLEYIRCPKDKNSKVCGMESHGKGNTVCKMKCLLTLLKICIDNFGCGGEN